MDVSPSRFGMLSYTARPRKRSSSVLWLSYHLCGFLRLLCILFGISLLLLRLHGQFLSLSRSLLKGMAQPGLVLARKAVEMLGTSRIRRASVARVDQRLDLWS